MATIIIIILLLIILYIIYKVHDLFKSFIEIVYEVDTLRIELDIIKEKLLEDTNTDKDYNEEGNKGDYYGE